MSGDDNTDGPEDVAGTIRRRVNPGRELKSEKALRKFQDRTDLGRKSLGGEVLGGYSPNYTVTSSAYTSAELFAPDQAPLIKAYQSALKDAEKGDVFALSTGKVKPRDIGIATALEPEITQTYAEFEYSERQAKGNFRKDIWKYVIGGIVTAIFGLMVWGVKELISSV